MASALKTCRLQAATSRPSASSRRVVPVRASSTSEPKPTSTPSPVYKHFLLTILDANPYLSDGSRLAVAAAATLSKSFSGSKITVLVVDEPGTDKTDPAKRIDSISWHLKDKGCAEFELVERATTQPASVLVGDVADEVSADMVLVSSEAVHAKHVNANQLAEFVSCPVLICP